MTYTIVNVPIPNVGRTHKTPKYPFKELEIHQSFFLEASQISKECIASQCSKWGKRYGRKYRFALVENNKIQVWREL